jgi:hypothetical protein
MKKTGKKRFDYAIMNPPYDRNLHLKFLEKVIKVADKTVNISPVRWLQECILKDKQSPVHGIDCIHKVSPEQGKILFGVDITMDLGIYECQGNNTDLSKLYYVIDNYEIVSKIKNKCKGSDLIKNHFVEKSDYPLRAYYGVSLTHDDVGNIISMKESTAYDDSNITIHNRIIGCASEIERKNLYQSMKTVFFKFMVYSFGMGSIPYWILPWMGDYTKPWTNARFCEYFGITGFISDTEAEPGSEWETILETMKKYA